MVFQVWHLDWQYTESYISSKSWPIDSESDYFCKFDSSSTSFCSVPPTCALLNKQVNFPNL